MLKKRINQSCSYFAVPMKPHHLWAWNCEFGRKIGTYRLLTNLQAVLFPRINYRPLANEKTDGDYNVK